MLTTDSTPSQSPDSAPRVAHHFDDLQQQHSASLLGMWIFLATELMFFGGLFTAYTIYRNSYHEAFAAGSRRLDIVLGTANTAVLLCSSLTMALAVDAAHRGRQRALLGFLAATMLLGSAFLTIKFTEYYHKYEDHHLPVAGLPFRWQGPHAEQVRLFFGVFLGMTGFHALHMVVGIGLLAWLWRGAWRRRYAGAGSYPVEICGLYWHFVDIVW